MITAQLKADLYNKFYYIINTFGTVENFINFIALRLRVNINDVKVELELHRLLTHAGSIKVVSPWALRFSLNMEDSPDSNSAVISEPYSVFNFKGELLYSVSNHNQIFGNSLLDKCLVLESEDTSMYYLTYSLYNCETAIVLLLVNLISTEVKDSETYTYTTIKSPLTQLDTNQVTFDIGSLNTDVSLFLLPSVPANTPTKEFIKYNKNSKYQKLYANTGNYLLYYPPCSGWLVATEEISSQFLKFGEVNGIGDDRFLAANTFIRYVALSDVDPLILRRNLGHPQPLLESPTINLACKLYI